ncbi:MAG: hypothetical protein ABEH86_06025 [Haloarcula sp.]
MPDSNEVKAALATLVTGEAESEERTRASQLASEYSDDPDYPAARDVGEDSDYRTVIERATEATTDLDAAVAFVETVGVDRLDAAVEQAEHEVSGLADEGRAALHAFREYRDAAAGPSAQQ